MIRAPRAGLSLQRKLRRVITTTSTIALVMAATAFVAYDVISFRAKMVRDLQALAGVIATNSSGSLAFDDKPAAIETLAALRSKPNVVSAAIYRSNGELFASYSRESDRPAGRNSLASDGSRRSERSHVILVQPILVDGVVTGTVSIKSDTNELYARFRSYGIAISGALLFSILASFLMAWRLQRIITTPILNLADVAQVVSEERDYTVRAPEQSADELRVLTDAFNDMLGQIELRDAALQEAHDELEKLVRHQTAELRLQVNERLEAQRELHEREKQLRQSQKMEAVGRLAGGIAHDFNNLLTAITGYAALMFKRLERNDPLRSNAEEIQKASARASGLTRQLLAFSRKQVLEPRVLELNSVITNMENMLRRLIGEKVELIAVQTLDLGRVKADPSQIEQVVLNLCVNARDAMPQGGRLTVEAANVELLDGAEPPHSGMNPGSYVVLQVSDTGCGMDEATRSRIYEPFFTTKEMGKGTGLGLSTVYGIVNQSGGHICIDTELGRGSTFRVYLPRVHEDIQEDVAEPKATATARGVETILLVEDEEMVRDLAREILEMSGYTVIEAPHGGEALTVSERFGQRIDMMVTDVVMPELNGRELYERLAPLRPEMKVLYMSGYTDDVIDSEGVLASGMAFLQKPFTPEEFAFKVRSVLDGQDNA